MLAAEDLSLTVSTDQESGAHVLAGQGVLHLRRTRGVLRDDFGVETVESTLTAPLRETITRKMDVHYRHKKQTGGAGQFADVRIKVAPAARGEGFSFDQTIHGGSVPRNTSQPSNSVSRSKPMTWPRRDDTSGFSDPV